jgi:hypothetical protein
VKVWAPGVEVAVGKDSGKVKVSIPAEFAADRLWLRLVNDEGTSAALPLLVGDLAEILEKEPNNSLEEAQEIPAGQGIANGVLQSSGDVDGFAVTVEAGQTLVASLDANNRLGSPFDAILQVATQDGFVLAENHDGVGLDPRLAYEVKEAGTYIVRVFGFPSAPNSTIGFAGAATYVYRLTITSGPFIANAGRLSATLASPGEVTLHGWNLPEGARLPVLTTLESLIELESNAKKQISPAARIGFVHSPGFGGSARVRLVPHAVHEGLAGGAADSPSMLTPSVAVTGCLSAAKEVDHYLLQLKKGQTIAIFAESASFDLPVIPLMRLSNPDGSDAVSTPDPGTAKETFMRYTAKVDGDHLLRVFDRYRHGSPRHFYQLTMTTEHSDFELSVASDAITVAPDKPAEVEVTVARRNSAEGKVGVIAISVSGLPDGVTAAAVTSEVTGDTQKKVKLVISSTGTAFSGPIQIVGKTTEPREMERAARTPIKLGNCFEILWLTALAK